MLKFTADGKNGTMFFLGLSRGNIDRLVAGQPIKVDLSEMGGPPIEIGILFGETEKSLFDDLKGMGLLPPGIEFGEAVPGVKEVVRFKRDPETGENRDENRRS